jgi:uncharacterized membrane protein YjjB (DUF3815 family)
MNIEVLLTDALWSAVAAVGFAVLFNTPPRLLIGVAIVGAAGHAFRTGVLSFGVSTEAATLLASLLVGFLSIFLGRRWNAPPLIFAVLGGIPMVPGATAYRTMLGFIEVVNATPWNRETVMITALADGIKTALIIAAIALGIAFPTLLFKRPKPVV